MKETRIVVPIVVDVPLKLALSSRPLVRLRARP